MPILSFLAILFSIFRMKKTVYVLLLIVTNIAFFIFFIPGKNESFQFKKVIQEIFKYAGFAFYAYMLIDFFLVIVYPLLPDASGDATKATRENSLNAVRCPRCNSAVNASGSSGAERPGCTACATA